MRASWEALHASFICSILTLQADQAFQEIKRRHSALAAFADSRVLVGFLTNKEGDLDEKDHLLGTLVTLVQRGEHHELAGALVWLGLWPGLDAAHRRVVKRFASCSEELVSDFSHAFTELVKRLNLDSVTRVAATLVRSTERDVVYARKRARTARMRRVQAEVCSPGAFVDGSEAEAAALAPEAVSQANEVLDLLVGEVNDNLLAWLRSVVGKDAELVLAVLVADQTQRLAGERLGLTHAAARKRFQRALERLREHIAKIFVPARPLRMALPISGPMNCIEDITP